MACVFGGCFGFLAKNKRGVDVNEQGDDIYTKVYMGLYTYGKPKPSLWSTIKAFFKRYTVKKTVSDVIAPPTQLIPEAPPLEVELTDTMRDVWDQVVLTLRAAPVHTPSGSLSHSSSCSSLTSVSDMSDIDSDITSVWESDLSDGECDLSDFESVHDSPLPDWEFE